MDPDFAPRRSDMLDTIAVVVCVAIGVGSLGIAAWLSFHRGRGWARWRGIGR